jgi:hypothetical protein
MSCDLNAGQNCYINIANRSFENVVKFRYLRMMLKIGSAFMKELKAY